MDENLATYMALPYRMVLWFEDGEWSAVVPDLPGCVAGGLTKYEVLEAIEDAKVAWISSALLEGAPVPEPSALLVA
ncbi:type II toxin-antitoxin system HicB family antitoxin [Chloroflexota bacterium]